MTPFPLPRFTFLCGRPNNGQEELANALVSADPDACFFDLEEPLRMVAHTLFFGGYHGEELPSHLPFRDDDRVVLSTSDFVHWLDCELSAKIGGSYLGKIALNNEMLDGSLFPHIIYRDERWTSGPSLRVFGAHFGYQNILAIVCEKNYILPRIPSLRHIRVAGSITERLDQLQTFLGASEWQPQVSSGASWNEVPDASSSSNASPEGTTSPSSDPSKPSN